jgi:hypothetical protein
VSKPSQPCLCPGKYDAFENDWLFRAEAETIKAGQRALSASLRGLRSKPASKAKKALPRRHRKLANRHKDCADQDALIVAKKLSIRLGVRSL